MRRPCAGSGAGVAPDPAVPHAPGLALPARPVRFGAAVVLDKTEVFDLCDLLGRVGARASLPGVDQVAVAAAAWVGELEDRLARPHDTGVERATGAPGGGSPR